MRYDNRRKLSAPVLRHAFLTRMVRQGSDLVVVAEPAGHRRLETTRRSSLPSDVDDAAAEDGRPARPHR